MKLETMISRTQITLLKFIVNVDATVCKILTSKQCFSLLAGIYKANTYGANYSEKIVAK